MSQDLYFALSKDYEKEIVEKKKEGSGYKIIDGKVFGRSSSIWFTNIDIAKRQKSPCKICNKACGKSTIITR